VIQDTIIQKNALDMPVLRIQIRIILKLGPDLDPHQSEKQDPDPDLHQSQKQDPAPYPGPQQIKIQELWKNRMTQWRALVAH
jgi:hypothetical protein